MAYLNVLTALEQYGVFLEITFVTFQRIDCQYLGISVDRSKQDVLLKFMLSNRQIIYCSNFDILDIKKGTQF